MITFYIAYLIISCNEVLLICSNVVSFLFAAQRLPPPPGYTTTSAVQPLNEIHTSTVRTQPANGVQQREVVNGVKQFIPLTSLNTQGTPRNTVATERTWFPNPRQGEVASQGNTSQHVVYVNSKSPSKHPAPLPVLHVSSNIVGRRVLLPSPSIRISHSPEGVVLSWNITTNQDHPTVKKYYLYAYQVLNTPPSTSHWKRIGEVGALPPPMACTLNQFQPGSTYFLAICAVDVYDIPGLFSKTEEVVIPRWLTMTLHYRYMSVLDEVTLISKHCSLISEPCTVYFIENILVKTLLYQRI